MVSLFILKDQSVYNALWLRAVIAMKTRQYTKYYKNLYTSYWGIFRKENKDMVYTFENAILCLT